MKAIVIKKDSSLSWEDVPDVRPGKDEVLTPKRWPHQE